MATEDKNVTVDKHLLTPHERERLQALQSYDILDTPEEPEFDALVKLASQICGTEISQINFVDRDRQWNKATNPPTPKEMPRGGSFCSYTILEDEWMVVENVSEDDRFQEFPFVKEDPQVRFYAGVNLKSEEGYNVGTICVLGFESKRLEDWQLESLKTLAREVEGRLELRRNQHELEEKNKELERKTTFLENSTDLVMMVDPTTYTISSVSGRVHETLSYPSEELHGMPLTDLAGDDKLREALDGWNPGKDGEFENEFQFLDKSGKAGWLRLHINEKKNKLYVTARDITRRKRQEQQIESSLEEKKILLAEIHHRVKNNLAIISGMLQLELYQTESEETQKIIGNSQMRIQSMAEVHELLYQTGDFSNVPLHTFVDKLVKNITRLYSTENREISVEVEVSDVKLNVNQAIPAAIIINELVTNACKHAFEDREHGQVKVTIRETGNRISLAVSDNGGGLPTDIDPASQESIGFSLVNELTRQLEAELEVEREDGTAFIISFPIRESKGSSSSLQLT
ncbi:MAG: histidine kinase dimerization/phosphoacceptor domain -containing protein [Balneolaceae bacterium]|nr:histidine kinase dimerization/phosphoacceptor domain -containing protein [Balneolaceae bacterium]